MSIFGWIAFAIINAIILLSLDYNPDKTGPLQTSILGIIGALGSGLFMYLAARGMTSEFALTFSMIIILEGFLLMTLLFTKLIRRV
jgi:hypothetical protein